MFAYSIMKLTGGKESIKILQLTGDEANVQLENRQQNRLSINSL
jgi:hypothetical protein